MPVLTFWNYIRGLLPLALRPLASGGGFVVAFRAFSAFLKIDCEACGSLELLRHVCLLIQRSAAWLAGGFIALSP